MTVPRSHIRDMASYALANLEAPAGKRLISLSQNESFRPPSPRVVDAVENAIASGMLYPDPDWRDLREKLAQIHGVNSENILCGNGSLDLIGAIALVYSGPDRAVLAPEHSYPFFRTAAEMAGARFDVARENDCLVCVQTLLEAVKPDTGVVCIANPGNPTGTRVTIDEIIKLRAELREDILLIVDEAYGEFADHLDTRCFDLVGKGNTIVLRTFSKAYGLAGFRVGWGAFPYPIATEVRKVLNPNNVAFPSQVAALAALEDQEYMQETCSLTIEYREAIAGTLRNAGFSVFPSFTNFILIDCGSKENAQDLDEKLRNQGIFLRWQSGAGLPDMLRMTIGTQEINQLAVQKMTEWKAGSRI